MKKREIKTLKFKKATISNFETLKLSGGVARTDTCSGGFISYRGKYACNTDETCF